MLAGNRMPTPDSSAEVASAITTCRPGFYPQSRRTISPGTGLHAESKELEVRTTLLREDTTRARARRRVYGGPSPADHAWPAPATRDGHGVGLPNWGPVSSGAGPASAVSGLWPAP